MRWKMKWKPLFFCISAVIIILLIKAATVQRRKDSTESHAQARAQPEAEEDFQGQLKKDWTESHEYEYEYEAGPRPAQPKANVEPKWVHRMLTLPEMEQLMCPRAVEATVGGNVTLDFHFKSQLDVTRQLIEWKFNNSIHVLVYRSRGVANIQADQFKSRATLESTDNISKGKLAVKISALTKTDAGTYSCFVRRGKKIRSCSVELIIADQKVIIQDFISTLKSRSKEHIKPVIVTIVKTAIAAVVLCAALLLIKKWIRAK